MDLTAQKKHNIIMDWKIAAMLPAKPNEEVSLGFAGAISGDCDGNVIVAGGANFPNKMPWNGGKKVYYDHIYIYKKQDGHLKITNSNYRLPEPIAYSACASSSRGIIYAGGESDSGLSNKVFVVQITNDSILEIKSLPDLPIANANASLVIVKEKVYLAGGESLNGTCDQLIVLDLNNLQDGWKKLPSLPLPVSYTVMVFQQINFHDKLYLLGGRKKTSSGISDLYNNIFSFDIATNTWDKKAKLPYSLSAGTGVAINDEQILLIGGDKGTTFNKVESLIAAINTEADVQKKELLNTQKIKIQATHPGFSNELLLYDSIKDTCISIGIIPFVVPVTTNTFIKNNEIFITSGEIKAGVRAPYILSGKLLQ
jgi:cyclically-permuted mutarotase family protein